MRERLNAQSLNGGESGSWLAVLDPDATRPVQAPPHLSDRDISELLSRLEPLAPSPSTAPAPVR